MKRNHRFGVVLSALGLGLSVFAIPVGTVVAQNSAGAIRCQGIVQLHDFRAALISPSRLRDRTLILDRGQRDGDTEVVAIKPELAVVRVRFQGTNELELRLADATPVSVPGMAFEGAE